MQDAAAGGGLVPEILLNIAFIVFTTAFLVRDILWLRLIAISGNMILLYIGFTAPGGPLWNHLFWYGVFILVNGGHSALLVYERSLMRFSEEEDIVRRQTFPSLDRIAVKKLIKLGHWTDLAPGETLLVEGKAPSRLYLLADGEASVTCGGQYVARVKQGQFAGEISYLKEERAGATVSAATPLRCLVWDRRKLRQRLDKDSTLRAVLYAAFGSDLSGKIAAHNILVSESAL